MIVHIGEAANRVTQTLLHDVKQTKAHSNQTTESPAVEELPHQYECSVRSEGDSDMLHTHHSL